VIGPNGETTFFPAAATAKPPASGKGTGGKATGGGAGTDGRGTGGTVGTAGSFGTGGKGTGGIAIAREPSKLARQP
jgi:hypothetical protein